MLTEQAVRAARATERPVKLFDGRGLYLLVTPAGNRLWRFKYRFEGREKLISLGAYPEVRLKKARMLCDDARRKLAEGIDPSAERASTREARANTFKAIATEWLSKRGSRVAAATLAREKARLEAHVLPFIGARPIDRIEAKDLLRLLRRLEAGARHETAHRARSLCSRIFRYAIATGRAERDVAADLKGALVPTAATNFAALTDPKRIGDLLRAIDGYDGQPATAAALKLAPLVFVRPGELRGARWDEFDLKAAKWRIPAARMKMNEQHLVPLSRQAVAILEDLQPITGAGVYVFPGLRSASRPISENTINAALRRLGYAKDEMTGHGFRTVASTCLNEQGWDPNLIELQLAHKDRNRVRAAYNRAERLAERTKMMQAWADYLDGLKASKNVVAIRSA